MLKFTGWVFAAGLFGFLIWQAVADVPYLPRILSASGLVALSGLIGIRLGSNSATRYMSDLHRMNKVLVEQNRGLTEANSELLQRAASELREPNSTSL